MSLFKNGVGRPSNETLKKRRLFVVAIALLVVALVGGFGYYFLVVNNGNVSGEDKNATTKNGDIDGNGEVTLKDAYLVLSHSAKISTLSNSNQKKADMNNDGKITAADARLVLQKIRFKLGDIDGNGKVNLNDAEFALKVANKTKSATSAQIKRGDMTADGKITAMDARLIYRAVYPNMILGDINQDGKLTATDYMKIIQFSSKQKTPTLSESILADVNQNGKIEAADARIIMRLVDGKASFSYRLGDVNMDKKITIDDATLALNASASLKKLDATKTLLADMDGNGKVQASDARTILITALAELK